MTMLDAIRRTHPHLLTPRPMCEHCGVRRAQVGVLCATCDEDPDEKSAFLAKQEDAGAIHLGDPDAEDDVLAYVDTGTL